MYHLNAGNRPTDTEIAVGGRPFSNLGPVRESHHATPCDWYLFLHSGCWRIAQVAEIRDHGHEVRFIGDGLWRPVAGMTALREP